MMFKISGYDDCHVCGRSISWEKTFIEPCSVSGVYTIDGQEADVVVVGKENNEIIYEAVVTCRYCGIKNKFVGKKSIK